MSRYDDAVAELYQAPHGTFVAERKRLAAALKAAGDKPGATRLGKLARPTISAWAVNQLWWHARDAFDALLATADRLRDGKLDAVPAHREAIAKLRARAARILTDAGHGPTESTLRRITQTLAALAATGGFDPDPPGALATDRDPPGFEAVGMFGLAAESATEPAAPMPAAPAPRAKPSPAAPARDEIADARRRKQEAEDAERTQAAAERRRLEAERARITAEKHRLEGALRTAKDAVAVEQREIEKLREQLADAEDSFDQARAVVEDLEAKLDQLDQPDELDELE